MFKTRLICHLPTWWYLTVPTQTASGSHAFVYTTSRLHWWEMQLLQQSRTSIWSQFSVLCRVCKLSVAAAMQTCLLLPNNRDAGNNCCQASNKYPLCCCWKKQQCQSIGWCVFIVHQDSKLLWRTIKALLSKQTVTSDGGAIIQATFEDVTGRKGIPFR